MSTATPLPFAKSVPEHSETTRFMCASVFLGHHADILKKLRTYVNDRYHSVADNHALNVRLLARVLDFFDQKRLRYLAWHGLIGVFCFLILSVVWLTATEDMQPLVIFLIAIAAIAFAIPAHRRYMRNHYYYALRHFARDNFDEQNAMEAFKNSRGKLEGKIAAQEAPGNVSVYGGFEPFVGAGNSLGNWSLLIDTRRGKEGESPIKFTEQELERTIAAAFRQLPFPGLEIGERLFVHGTEVSRVDGLLPDRFARPRQRVSEETLARFRHTHSREARVYQFVGTSAWGDQVRISFFYRAIFKGPMLYIETHSRVLQPIWVGYREVDNLTTPNTRTRITLFLGQTVGAPLVCMAECFWLFGLMRAHNEIRKFETEQKTKIEEQARFNYGAVSSLRESFATAIYDHFFEKSDRDLYVKAIQKQLLDSIIDFLDMRNVDTSDLRDQRTYIINSGLIVHGGLQAGAVAVGEEAKAITESGKRTKAKKVAAGGVAT